MERSDSEPLGAVEKVTSIRPHPPSGGWRAIYVLLGALSCWLCFQVPFSLEADIFINIPSWKIDSKTPYRYQNLGMLKSRIRKSNPYLLPTPLFPYSLKHVLGYS